MTITVVKEKSFYYLLPLYKSLLFYFVKFKPSPNLTPQTKLVIKGLNIKNRRKRITYVYDKCCEIIENNEKGQDVCGFVNKQCFKQRLENKGQMYGCCSPLCVTENGCTTKNLSCKLIFCKEAKQNFKVIEYKDLKLLRLLSLKNQLIVWSDFYSTREEVLGDLYCYTITFTLYRIAYRRIRNLIKNLNKNV